jgi:hypothetical protein
VVGHRDRTHAAEMCLVQQAKAMAPLTEEQRLSERETEQGAWQKPAGLSLLVRANQVGSVAEARSISTQEVLGRRVQNTPERFR